jgi:YgiT-type zinc finger domain-containing protein
MRPLRGLPGEQNHHPSAAVGGELYEFESVPALVCSQCGEVWLEAEVGQLIDKIIRQHPQPKRYHQVPVFSLAEFSL